MRAPSRGVEIEHISFQSWDYDFHDVNWKTGFAEIHDDRLTQTRDPKEQSRLKEELAQMTFGE